MKTASQLSDGPQFANPTKRQLVEFIVDASGSTANKATLNGQEDSVPKIDRFAEGLLLAKKYLCGNQWFASSGEIATITFGSSVRSIPFQSVTGWDVPALQPDGATPTGAALNAALDHVLERMLELDAAGTLYYTPYLMLLSDGVPYGEHADYLRAAVERARDAEHSGNVTFLPIGVDETDCGHLTALGFRTPPEIVSRTSWNEVFVRVSVRISSPETQRSLAVPTTNS
ncbi:MAG: hypothetical protein IT427_05345 [Pirellulales bacterium]|nr:hypothetical protein [Pirellulales bacterium]